MDSTGALERGDYRTAVSWMVENHIDSMELSALCEEELEPLLDHLGQLPLERFGYVSFHAPSAFPREREERIVELLRPVGERGLNIIVHPDVIYTPQRWASLGKRLLIENMDRRKTVGRTADELQALFERLPEARLCLDVAHARQLDTTPVLLWQIVTRFADRIAEVHISELDSLCKHRPMSQGAVDDYRRFAHRLVGKAPVIIESTLDSRRASLRMDELHLAREAMAPA